jgi:coenzyme F420-reducing hydrogenase beta subunit
VSEQTHKASLKALPGVSDLIGTVVRGGCCIGCGVCAGLNPEIQIARDEAGRYVAKLTATVGDSQPCSSPALVCPFADGNPDEDELGREQFGTGKLRDSHIGYYCATYAGYVSEGDFRAAGSSGGIASWLLTELLSRRQVDYVAHVAPRDPGDDSGPLFRYVLSTTADEVRLGSKSRYYPVEMSGIIASMLRQPGRYAVVGIPCFIKGLRLACRQSPVLRERLAFTVGIVCGHLKSAAFAEMYGWQCGISPADLRGIDFRTKLPGRPASDYAFTATGLKPDGPVSVIKPIAEAYGSNWGYGFFKYKACDFCDDVVGETADISFGDAWLSEYESDSSGTNMIVVRSPLLQSVLKEGASQGRLHLDTLSVDRAIASQAGGFRHRRDGLAYRLHLEDKAGRWRPAKRVQPNSTHLSRSQKRLFELRSRLAELSHVSFLAAKQAGDFDVFVRKMDPLIRAYDKFYRPALWLRALRKAKRLVCRLVSRGH